MLLRRLSEEYDPDTQRFRQLRTLATQLEPSLNRPLPLGNAQTDFVIITALQDELDAVLRKLPEPKPVQSAPDDVRTYFKADLPVTFLDGTSDVYNIVVLSLIGMGRLQAGLATKDAIYRWQPKYVLLVGIAAGLPKSDGSLQLGDILIADQIVDYELQKLTPEKPEVRWAVHPVDPTLLGAIAGFRENEWEELITVERPEQGASNCHKGPIASGDKVINRQDLLESYREVWPKLIGAEMEAGGVVQAAFQSANRPGFFMIRSVVDYASNKDDTWRAYACDAAAAYTVSLLKKGPVPK